MNKDVLVTQIYMTKDYSKFKFIKENRIINARNYAKLIDSMKKEQLIIPILVNEKMEIIDGQHRYTVCKELGLPIYYYVQKGYGIKEVIEANKVMLTWKSEDFLKSHIAEGNEDYIVFETLLDRYHINLSDMLKLFALVQGKNKNIVSKLFNEGAFKLEGREKVVACLEALNDFKFFDYYRTLQFVGAFTKLYFQKDYNHSTMKERLKKRSGVFEHKSSISDYLVMLTKDVYSFGPVKKVLYYDPDTNKFYN